MQSGTLSTLDGQVVARGKVSCTSLDRGVFFQSETMPPDQYLGQSLFLQTPTLRCQIQLEPEHKTGDFLPHYHFLIEKVL